jgi:hypothetical protein
LTDQITQTRGYDDSAHLKEMADGIITRRFASVEEAAKAVLGEEAGSNVDRLRRKFREQNWYERGLSDYVEAKIARRATLEIDEVDQEPVANEQKTLGGAAEIVSKQVRELLVRQFTPTGTIAFLGIAFTSALTVLQMRPLSGAFVVITSVVISILGLVLWADKEASHATGPKMWLQLAAMSALWASLVAVFGITVPDPRYRFGSSLGDIAVASAGLVFGIYISGLVLAHGKRTARPKSPEIMGLAIAALIFSSMLGVLPLMSDLVYSNKRTEQGMDAYLKVNKAYQELRKTNPELDLHSLMDVQREIVQDAVRFPKWAGEE